MPHPERMIILRQMLSKFPLAPARTATVALLIALGLSAGAYAQDNDASAEAIALFNSGQDAHEKGDLTTAIQNYEKAIKLVAEFPEAELQRGNAYLALGKLDDAETAIRRAVTLREDWSLALASLGSVLVSRDKFAEAQTYLTKAIELDENNFPAYVAMTELRLRTKADSKVLGLLLARLSLITLKANPPASIWASRAAIELATGDLRSARMSAARAVQIDPRSPFALSTSAEIALREGDPTAAEIFVTKMEASAPTSENVKALRARVLVTQGRTDDAIALLNSIAKPSPETMLLKTGIIAATSTNPADLEKQLSNDPANVSILSRLCSALRISDPTKALEYCRRASEAAPGSVEPVIGYAAALVRSKRYEEAVFVLRRLLTIAPANSTVRANLGTALFQLKRWPEAKVEFRWLTENRPDGAIAYYFLGIVHDQLGEFADAAANYHQFLRLADPESSKLEIEKVNLRLPIIQKLLKDGKGKRRG